MTLQQLEYVVALDTYRHFVTAAEKSFVTQPTITTQIKKLEEEIGMMLFDRSRHPLVPTPAGSLFIAKAKTILSEVSDLKTVVNEELRGIDGKFRVGVIPTISPYLIPLISGDFSDAYPSTVLEIEEMQTNRIVNALNRKEIDVGILVTPLEEPSIREIRLYNEPFIFYGELNHPLNQKSTIIPKDVEKLNDLWLLNEGHCFRNQVLSICRHTPSHKNIHFQSGSIEALKNMVDNYGGFTLIPQMSLNMEDQQRGVSFSSPQPVREVSLAVHSSFAKQALLDALREQILDKIPSNFVSNRHFFTVVWK